MGVVISGIAAAIVLAGIAAIVLSAVQQPVYEKYASPSVRVDPGTNLVGERWTGNPAVSDESRRAGTESRSGGR